MAELTDEQWMEGLTYYDMLDHFATGGPQNRMHTGALGKRFSELMDKKRATLTPEMVTEVHNNVLKKMGNATYKGVKH